MTKRDATPQRRMRIGKDEDRQKVMDELMEQKAVSEEIEETVGCELAGDIHTTRYGEYKVISTFSDTGESITDLLSAYIDRVASLKY